MSHGSRADACPAQSPQPGRGSLADAPLRDSPIRAEVCPDPGVVAKSGISRPVELDAGPAGALVGLLRTMPPSHRSSKCLQGTRAVLRFFYRQGPPVDAVVRDGWCRDAVVVVNGDDYDVDGDMTAVLTALAGSRDLKGSSGKAPDLFGLAVRAAAARAHRHRWDLVVQAQGLDAAVPANTVLLQVPPPAGQTIGRQVAVVVSTPSSPTCRAQQLVGQFRHGGEGAGNMFATLLVRDASGAACSVNTPMRLTPLDAQGRPMTTQRQLGPFRPDSLTVLTPHAAAVATDGRVPPEETVLGITLTGEYRDGPGPDGLCPAGDEVAPASWRLTIGSGSLRIVGSDGPGQSSGISACLGAFSVAAVRRA